MGARGTPTTEDEAARFRAAPASSDFEFIAHDGSLDEVDLLAVSLHCVYLVEAKSGRGALVVCQSLTVGYR